MFVEENSGWFSSDIRETAEDILYFEKELGFKLPVAMKWLLTEYGYSASCGLENLSASVLKTIELRDTVNLPDHVFILVDWNDAGVVLMLAGSEKIIRCEMDDVYNYIETERFPKAVDVYENYPDWVQTRFEQENEEAEY